MQLPVIASGAVSDARGIAAAFMLGAAGVQVGSAYLHCPESKISAPHRAALAALDRRRHRAHQCHHRAAGAWLLNRVIREVGPINAIAPEFPLAAGALLPLRAKAEAAGSGDFSPLWSGQAAALGPRHAGTPVDDEARRGRAGADGPDGRVGQGWSPTVDVAGARRALL